MTEAKNCNNEKWPMPKKFGYTVFILIAFVLPMRSQSTDDANILNHKQKVITFKDADKIVVGPVDKKEFVSGQYVAIYDYHFNEAKYYDVYIENGKLVVKQGKEKTSITPFLSGIYYGNASIPYIKGELYDGGVTMKGCFSVSNMSDNDKPKLSPVTKGKWRYCGSSLLGLVSQAMGRSDERYFNISPAPDYGPIEISARNVPFDKYSETNRFDVFTYGNGRNYRISAIPTKSVENIDSITFTANGQSEVIPRLSVSVLDIISLSDGKPTIHYHNGDTFTGSIRNMKPEEGTYRYHTGEILEGRYHPVGADAFRFRYVDCKLTFNDGTVADDEWLKQYDKPLYDFDTLKPNVRFENEDWDELNRCSTWTEMRDRAAEKYQFRLQEFQQNEIAEKQKKDERRAELIAKYGQNYGSLLAQGKISVGMTSKMVTEIYPKRLYQISQLTSGGKNEEVWTFNRQLVNDNALLGLTYGLVDALGYDAPKILVFIGGKLRDIIR